MASILIGTPSAITTSSSVFSTSVEVPLEDEAVCRDRVVEPKSTLVRPDSSFRLGTLFRSDSSSCIVSCVSDGSRVYSMARNERYIALSSCECILSGGVMLNYRRPDIDRNARSRLSNCLWYRLHAVDDGFVLLKPSSRRDDMSMSVNLKESVLTSLRSACWLLSAHDVKLA